MGLAVGWPADQRRPRASKGRGARRAGGADRGDLLRDRLDSLKRANLGLEKLRFFVRIACDLKVLDRRDEHAARSLDEAGRMVGGWRKAHDARAT